MAARVLSSIICVVGFTICISEEGKVFSFGKHTQGAHGHQELQVSHPTMISSICNVKFIACGVQHTVCLDINGSVFTFGKNNYGQLGIGMDSLSDTFHPQKVNLPPVKQISCGLEFTVCLSEDGYLYSFGYNKYSQLGHGNTETYDIPQKIQTIENVDFVECGGEHSYCKTLENDIYGWGSNYEGQLGLDYTFLEDRPRLCKPFENNVVDIKCGYNHTLILTENQEVYSCGSNDSGQLGRYIDQRFASSFKKIENLSEIIRIECGYSHSLCIDNYDSLYVFGDNFYGQLGLGDTEPRSTPVKHPSLSNIIDISSKGFHAFTKTSNNEIYTFGRNKFLQLGIETDEDNELTPIRVFEDKTNLWHSNIKQSKAKSARK